jgi:hypothetical protein
VKAVVTMLERRMLGVAALAAAAVLIPVSRTAATSESVPGHSWIAVDRADYVGLGIASAKSWSASTVDFNHDAAQDVLIGYHLHGAKLYMNLGDGSYQRVASSAWRPRTGGGRVVDRHNCAWADVDRNGLSDVYCSAGRTFQNHVKWDQENELWLQRQAGVFDEVGALWNVTDICGRGRSVAFLDANGDQYPDLFLGNEDPRRVSDPCDSSPELPNEESKLFVNVHGVRFHYARKMWRYGAEPGSRCAEVLDFNGDGTDDLFACRNQGHSPQLYAHLRGRGFVDVTARNHLLSPITDATVADLDGDHDKDLVTAAYGEFGYHLNNNGRFGRLRVIARPSEGRGRAVAVGDADGDGDGDVYGMIGDENPADMIWLNHDLHFTAIPVPPALGNADDVIALHPWNGTRKVAFLVLNGRRSRQPGGPVQFIRLVGG